MNNLRLILGGPGCGKTTRLLNIVEEELAAGIAPEAIAFCTFTRAAAIEAQTRAAAKFNLDAEDDLPWFRTIHSLAYRRLDITRDEVMDRRDWEEFSQMMGYHITGSYTVTDQTPVGSSGDQLLRIVDYAATTMVSLEEAWHELGEPVNWHELVYFDESFSKYKSESSKIDFTDMLIHYNHEGDPLPVKVGVIDEAQDLTASQWQAVRKAFSMCERVYVGGDDDQAIYRWAGADVDQFLRLSKAPEVLPVSHRLPEPVFNLAQGIASRISKRYEKRFSSTGEDGTVERHVEPEYVDMSSGRWLLLARNTSHLYRLEVMCRERGYNYTRRSGPSVNPKHVEAAKLWERLRGGVQMFMDAKEVRLLHDVLGRKVPLLKEMQRYEPRDFHIDIRTPWHDALVGIPQGDRDYYVSCLRAGESLTKPRVRIETIHGVKGAEEDNVMLMTDMSPRTYESYQKAPDHEHRVFYVGATRAKRSLHVIGPQTDRSYPL